MTTPLATIADALIEFILSLLRDPSVAAEFDEDPEGVLARNGLGDVCADDVRAVAPVVVDRPDVHPKPYHPGGGGGGGHHKPGPPTPEKEISHITNNFSIENRVSNIDQSVNQNIWAGGDVNQIFDQEAVLNQGDNSSTAGDDASLDNSETDVTVGDVSIGNDTITNNAENSFNETETETDTEVEAEESFNDNSTDNSTNVDIDDSSIEFAEDAAPVVADEPAEFETTEETI